MIKKWKLLSRETLLTHPRMTIVEDTIELPTGATTTYIREAPVKDSSVTTVAINEKGELLVQKEYSYPPNEVLYQLPGGHFDPNEDVVAAANRELSEESGYIGHTNKIIGYFYSNNRRSDMKQYVVLSTDLEVHHSEHDDEEFIESEWMPYETVKALIKDGKVVNVNMLAALQLYDAQK